MLTAAQLQLLAIIDEASQHLGMRVFLVGGVVRDLLRGGAIHERDLDFIVEGSAAAMARSVSERIGGTVVFFERFLTAKIQDLSGIRGIDEVDFATARTETYAKPGSLPVVQPTSIENDLRRRDFSMNAIALPIGYVREALAGACGISVEAAADHIIDVCGGVADLQRGVLRVLHPQSFLDDPTRMFRAMRYMARLGSCLEEATSRALHEAVRSGVMLTISAQRIKNELSKICDEDSWSIAIRLCEEHSLLVASGWMPPGCGYFPDLDPLVTYIHNASGAERLNLLLRLSYYARSPEEIDTFAARFSIPRRLVTLWRSEAAEVEVRSREAGLNESDCSDPYFKGLTVQQLCMWWWLQGQKNGHVKLLVEKELRHRHGSAWSYKGAD